MYAEAHFAEAIAIRARQPDGIGNLCRVISNDRLIKAVRATPRQERQVLQARNAICNNCGGRMPMKEQFSFREIAVLTAVAQKKVDSLPTGPLWTT